MSTEPTSSASRAKLSVTIIAGNAEKEIEGCLQSVHWADEIVVVDSFSKDRTGEVARKYTNRVIVREWEGYGKQKQFALDHAQHEWVLSIDSDERVTPELKTEIEGVLSNGSTLDGYYIPRRNFFLGKWIRHGGWYPGYQLRLFRKDKARVNERKIHESFLVDGSVGYLTNDILHFTHPTVQATLAKINEYSTLEAEEKVGRKRVTFLHVAFYPFFAFLQSYIWKRGFLDGVHGLMVAIIHATTKGQTYMKIWELQTSRRRQSSSR